MLLNLVLLASIAFFVIGLIKSIKSKSEDAVAFVQMLGGWVIFWAMLHVKVVGPFKAGGPWRSAYRSAGRSDAVFSNWQSFAILGILFLGFIFLGWLFVKVVGKNQPRLDELCLKIWNARIRQYQEGINAPLRNIDLSQLSAMVADESIKFSIDKSWLSSSIFDNAAGLEGMFVPSRVAYRGFEVQFYVTIDNEANCLALEVKDVPADEFSDLLGMGRKTSFSRDLDINEKRAIAEKELLQVFSEINKMVLRAIEK